MLRLIQGYNLSFPIYLDMEDKVQAVLSDSERGNIASVFCNIIQNEGYKVGIYLPCSSSVRKRTMPANAVLRFSDR